MKLNIFIVLLLLCSVFASSLLYIDETSIVINNDEQSVENNEKYNEVIRSGQKLFFEINICNDFAEDLEDVEIFANIPNLDDGSSFKLEDNEKIDIKKNDCETLELIFENDNRAPYELNSGDYKLNITAKGEYGVNRTFVNSEPFIVNLKFNQNRKDVLIKDARMDSKIIQCNENSVKVFYTIMNNGESDLDAAEVRITNRILNIFGVAYHSIKGDNGYTDSGFIELELPRDKLFDGSFIFEVTPSPLKSRAGIKTDRTEKLLLKREGCGINYKDWLAKKESGELDVNDNSDDDVIENDIVETVDDLNPIDNDSDILIETTDDKNDVNNNVDSNNKSLSFDVDKIVENRTVDDGSSIFKNILWFLLIIFIIVIIYFIFNLLF